MDGEFDKSEPKVEDDLSSRLNKLKGFNYDDEAKKLVINVSNLVNYCAALRIILPMLLSSEIAILVLALTKTIIWKAFFFVSAIILFTYLCATLALLCNRQKSYYVVSDGLIVRSVAGMTSQTYYSNVKEIRPRRSLFFKNGGSISFKLYISSGVNLQFYLLNGFKETCELLNGFLLESRADIDLDCEFERLLSNDDFDDLLNFVNHDSAQIDKLPDCLKVYYIMWTLYDEQCETGFDGFFINCTEITDKQLLQACELLGFPELTELCKRAVALNEKYDIANNENLPDECNEGLCALNDEFLDLDSKYGLEDMFKQYYIDNYEKFDFDNQERG